GEGAADCGLDPGSTAASLVTGGWRAPFAGFRNSRPPSLRRLKSNIRLIEPAAVSVAPSPMAGRCQLNSMNFTTELWSSSELLTKLAFAHGEISRNGSLGPSPHRVAADVLVRLRADLSGRRLGAMAG